MRKIVLLTSLAMLGTLVLAMPVLAQEVYPPICSANTIDQFPEGTVCTEGGGFNLPEETPVEEQYLQPMPEQLEAAQDFAAGGPVSCEGFGSEFGAQQFYDSIATPEQQAILDPDGNGFACDTPTAAQSTQPEAPVTTTALPATGGPSLALLAGALLIGGGLILRGRRS